jgi:hypothetical protein
MKTALILSLMILLPTGYAANAAQIDSSDYSDIDVISVAPRNPAIKPFVLAVFTKEQQQRIAATSFPRNQLPAKSFNLFR